MEVVKPLRYLIKDDLSHVLDIISLDVVTFFKEIHDLFISMVGFIHLRVLHQISKVTNIHDHKNLIAVRVVNDLVAAENVFVVEGFDDVEFILKHLVAIDHLHIYSKETLLGQYIPIVDLNQSQSTFIAYMDLVMLLSSSMYVLSTALTFPYAPSPKNPITSNSFIKLLFYFLQICTVDTTWETTGPAGILASRIDEILSKLRSGNVSQSGIISNVLQYYQITRLQSIQMQDNQKVLVDRDGEKRYIRGKLLGTGGFAKCFEARSMDTGQVYAAKVIPKKEINEKRKRYKLLLEIKIHRMFKHENIVRFIEVFEDNDNIYIILEYCPFNTLKELIKRRKRIMEFEARVYILQMIKALEFIHKFSIIHRDLKLGNILVNQKMQLKFCDFGLSTKVNFVGERKRTICGTPNYIAPQILEEEGHSYESDIWSIGVIIYTLLYGKPPFESNTVEETYENIRNNRFFFPDIGISATAKDLIKKILTTDPAKRLTLEEIKYHEFMTPIQEIPKTLPVYTLAMPPIHVESLIKTTPTGILRDRSSDRTMMNLKTGNQQQVDNIQELERQINNKKHKIEFDYIRQLLVSGGNSGYILSNGQMGVFLPKQKLEIILKNQKYYCCSNTQVRQIRSGEYEQEIQTLTNFVNFFMMKYEKVLKKMLLNSKSQASDVIFIKKYGMLEDEQLTRLSNGAVQMFFKDLSSLVYYLNDDRCLFYITKRGDEESYEYEDIEIIPNLRLQKKMKKFSEVLSLMAKRKERG